MFLWNSFSFHKPNWTEPNLKGVYLLPCFCQNKQETQKRVNNISWFINDILNLFPLRRLEKFNYGCSLGVVNQLRAYGFIWSLIGQFLLPSFSFCPRLLWGFFFFPSSISLWHWQYLFFFFFFFNFLNGKPDSLPEAHFHRPYSFPPASASHRASPLFHFQQYRNGTPVHGI